MVAVTYSMAGGLDYYGECFENTADRRTVEAALQAHGLSKLPPDQNEVVRVLRGIGALARVSAAGLKWADGRDLRFAFVVLFAEHVVPGGANGAGQSDAQLVAAELAYLTAQSLALRQSGNYVIFHGDHALVDGGVGAALRRVSLSQPGAEEKATFLKAGRRLYGRATFGDGLLDENVVALTCNTPNRGLESLLRASDRSGAPVTVRDLLARKTADVEQLSEGTLTLLDTSTIQPTALVGANIEGAARLLHTLGDALLKGNADMPANVLLAGPPGTGKTELARQAARQARAAAYRMNSPKGPYVGMTERLARLQQELLGEWTPNIAFSDEITEAFPMERHETDSDAGASRAVLAQLLTSLSDERRRGRALLIATTNCPWRIGSAMRSRFTVIPVLHPLLADFAPMIASIARELHGSDAIAPEAPQVREAASLFYEKGAHARHVRASLANARLLRGTLDPDAVLFGARDFTGSTDRLSMHYADFWAIKCCSSRAFLPWSGRLGKYTFPVHLVGIVDEGTGEVNHDELDRRIEEVRPHANL
ncbi:MAG: AAA family ATPase [Vicinamibacterales bacterium]